jgi:hypothetical protein
VHFHWMIVGISDVDTCPFMGKLYEDTWPNRRAPRVPLILVHLVLVAKVFGVDRIRTSDLPYCQSLYKPPLANVPPCVTCYEYEFNCI